MPTRVPDAGKIADVPSDVMRNPSLKARAERVSAGSEKKKRPKGFTFRDAGDALAGAEM